MKKMNKYQNCYYGRKKNAIERKPKYKKGTSLF